MKLPKSLIHSILVGITAGSMAACSFDEVKTACQDPACEHGISCPVNEESNASHCPACGRG